MVTNVELCANRKGEEVLEWDDFQRLWGMEKYDCKCCLFDCSHDAAHGFLIADDRGRNEELGADH